ncbi:MAG TPA: hypothetical protein VID04_18910 [Methylomirabilota bacterium]|jgi:hypothetical protein
MSDESRHPEPAPRTRERAPGWEEIAPGRYQPRRIRGSYRGRELG